MTPWQNQWRIVAPALLASALTLAGCAEPPPPTAQLRAARDAVARAEENGATALAPQTLDMAKNKLDQAVAAYKSDHMTTAEYLAEEAEVDADLASSSSNAMRLANTATELQGVQKRVEPRP